MSTIWALDQGTFDELQSLRRNVTAERIEAAHAGINTSKGSIVTVRGGVAEIAIEGLLLPRKSWMAGLLGIGCTTYSEIATALADAQEDASVKRIVLAINSPGGAVAGLFHACDAIAACSKPISTRVESLACSAAYALAAASGRIEASGRASTVGSVGVVTDYFVDDREVSITSTDAPDKRPDVRTESGRAVVRKELDGIHALLVDVIARGRGTSSSNVNANFGRGGVFLAGEALKHRMIDTIADSPQRRGALAAAGLFTQGPAAATAEPAGYAVVAANAPRQEGESQLAYVKRVMGTAKVPKHLESYARSLPPMVEGESQTAYAKRVMAGVDAMTESFDHRYQSLRSEPKHTASMPSPVAAPDMGDRIVALLKDRHRAAGFHDGGVASIWNTRIEAREFEPLPSAKPVTDPTPVSSAPEVEEDMGDKIVAYLKEARLAAGFHDGGIGPESRWP